MTKSGDDERGVFVSTVLAELPCDRKTLKERIQRLIADYHAAEATRSLFNRVNDEIEALESMAAALKLAQRKMRAAPQSLQLWADLNTREKWGGMVSEFERVVPVVLGAVEQAQGHMAEYRQGRGNAATLENRDILLATIKRWLCDAGAGRAANRKTKTILQTHGVPCPDDPGAFAKAASRGDKLLHGPIPEGSYMWLNEQLPKGRKAR